MYKFDRRDDIPMILREYEENEKENAWDDNRIPCIDLCDLFIDRYSCVVNSFNLKTLKRIQKDIQWNRQDFITPWSRYAEYVKIIKTLDLLFSLEVFLYNDCLNWENIEEHSEIKKALDSYCELQNSFFSKFRDYDSMEHEKDYDDYCWHDENDRNFIMGICDYSFLERVREHKGAEFSTDFIRQNADTLLEMLGHLFDLCKAYYPYIHTFSEAQDILKKEGKVTDNEVFCMHDIRY